MIQTWTEIEGEKIPVFTTEHLICGSGAAGYNAAVSLLMGGARGVTVLTEGRTRGTSRNTGSDKQTYYKLTLAGSEGDSVREMARTLFEGGSRHGDTALVEAALSVRCFSRLSDFGVPFPENAFGETVGYKTDHDPRQRATSAGPLTSKIMTECLEEKALRMGAEIAEPWMIAGIVTLKTGEGSRAAGIVAVNPEEERRGGHGIGIFLCSRLVYAVGGPAGIWHRSVYPGSQSGATGVALEAGAAGWNLQEMQFGLASVRFRWNVSGSYQQVLPDYFSTAPDGSDRQSFLEAHFSTRKDMLSAIFLKGYQWPFDAAKACPGGSSVLDLLVFSETVLKGRRVFMDFRRNPGGQLPGHGELSAEAADYLHNSGATGETPLARLMQLNPRAYSLYRDHGIDLATDPLEVDICAQHHNGGLAADIWSQSSLSGFYPVGEVQGNFGVCRPGGAALNATQTQSLRAAMHILANPGALPDTDAAVSEASVHVSRLLRLRGKMQESGREGPDAGGILRESRLAMSRVCGILRSEEGLSGGIDQCRHWLSQLDDPCTPISSSAGLTLICRLRDTLLTQLAVMEAAREYIRSGGASRGACLVGDMQGELPEAGLPEIFRSRTNGDRKMDLLLETAIGQGGALNHQWQPVRPVPDAPLWFEQVWNATREPG